MSSRSQIVATIGPASKEVEVLKEMIKNQMDIARLNFSHGTHEDHRAFIKNIREAASSLDKNIPIIQDLSGPRVSTEDGHGFDVTKDSVLTDKDIDDLKFGIEEGVEYVAMSYVGDEQDIVLLKEKISEFGGACKVIAKIERKEALEKINDIAKEADAIMVARGDLGDNIPLEEVPFAQKEIIEIANREGKPVIVATEMMLSMTENERPSRAEVTDVATAILENADAVMLSEETAKGKHPAEVVEIMERIVSEAESRRKRTPTTL